MGIAERVKDAWGVLAGEVAVDAQARDGKGRWRPEADRKTGPLPAVLAPFGRSVNGLGALPKPSAANLRRLAEMPVARRAINLVKDRVASMDWQIRVRRGFDAATVPDCAARMAALRRSLETPNEADSFRTLFEQVLEDVLVGGFGAAEMVETFDREHPVRLFALDGALIEVDPRWDGDRDTPHYGFRTGRPGADAVTPLKDDELMYVRLNPRTHTAFGLGRLEVAFESITQFLGANRYAGRLASNSVVQYALWLDEATPEEHDRLIRWWQDEMEGTGRVPVLSSEKKPEVIRFANGTDADLRLEWQEFLIRMIANAFDLPPFLLGITGDVNRSTAGELADEAFASAVKPVAKLLAEHISRDVFGKCLGWPEFEFVFNDLESRDEQEEVAMQVQLLNAGIVTVDEVRAWRGLPPLQRPGASAEVAG